MTDPIIFVSTCDAPASFHLEAGWAPLALAALVEEPEDEGRLERFVFSGLVQDALHGLEARGEVLELVPLPPFTEGNHPADVTRLTVYLDDFAFQRLHFVKQTMYPNRVVTIDQLIWTLCQHKLASANLPPTETAELLKPEVSRAPVAEDYRFNALFQDVFRVPRKGQENPSQAASEPEAPAKKAVHHANGQMMELYSPEPWRKFLKEVKGDDPRFVFLDQLSSRFRLPLALAPDEQALEALALACPHFSEVVAFVSRHATLCRAGGVAFSMPPILLLGPAGIGKTHFARQLGQCLGVDFRFVPMNSVSAGFSLTGTHRTWQKATPGLIAKTLLESSVGNPLFMLDELDKSGVRSHHGDPVDALYQLLEPETSATFSDEFFELPMDLSKALWIATANDDAGLAEPLTSRFKTFRLPALSQHQTLFVAQQLLADAVARYRLAEFSTSFDGACASVLAQMSARDMRIALSDAVGAALQDGRTALLAKDIERASTSGMRQCRVGFV